MTAKCARRLMLIGLAISPACWAAENCRELTSYDAEALATFRFESNPRSQMDLPADRTYRLRRIEVVRQNVFERADTRLERVANRYHPVTREDVIRSVLPMVEGDEVDARALEEAERILRAKVYLYDARVIPHLLCGDALDVFVVTRDVWTLAPDISITRTGGENEVGFGVTDTNLLGRGQYVSLFFQKDQDRRGATFAFSEPNVSGGRWAVDLLVSENDDGGRTAATVRYPFYALDTRHALSVSGDDFRRVEGLYFLGDELWEYDADSLSVRTFAGFSKGLQDDYVNRWLVGYAWEDHDFRLPDALLAAHPDLESPDRRYGYPFVGFQRLEDDFETRVNLDRLQRTEDVALGSRLYAELGYSTAGGSRHLAGRFSYGDAAWLTRRQLLSASAAVDGYYDLEDHAAENLTVEGSLAYRYRHARSWSLLVRGSATAVRHPTLDRQLLLGGAEGLRGYPNRYQSGDRRFRVTVEERYYSKLYPLRIFRLGAAAFLDVGRAWYADDVPAWLPQDRGADYFDVLANVGLGLRLESTRTRGDQIIHVDLAMPLRDGPGVRGVELTVTAKRSL